MSARIPTPHSLLEPIWAILNVQADGISEYDLLRRLEQVDDFFAKRCLDSLSLFQRHFLLFHCLYLLHLDLLEKQTGMLQITPLDIRILDYQGGSTGLGVHDPLQAYYLDLDNLQAMNAQQVIDLIDSFWIALSHNESRGEALEHLGLSDPVDDQTIRRRYQELVMRHHPDRGGDHETLQRLNAAISHLLPKSC